MGEGTTLPKLIISFTKDRPPTKKGALWLKNMNIIHDQGTIEVIIEMYDEANSKSASFRIGAVKECDNRTIKHFNKAFISSRPSIYFSESGSDFRELISYSNVTSLVNVSR